jgi:hypothetical protein
MIIIIITVIIIMIIILIIVIIIILMMSITVSTTETKSQDVHTLLTKNLAFVESEVSLPFSQKEITGIYPEQVESKSQLHILIL